MGIIFVTGAQAQLAARPIETGARRALELFGADDVLQRAVSYPQCGLPPVGSRRGPLPGSHQRQSAGDSRPCAAQPDEAGRGDPRDARLALQYRGERLPLLPHHHRAPAQRARARGEGRPFALHCPRECGDRQSGISGSSRDGNPETRRTGPESLGRRGANQD